LEHYSKTALIFTICHKRYAERKKQVKHSYLYLQDRRRGVTDDKRSSQLTAGRTYQTGKDAQNMAHFLKVNRKIMGISRKNMELIMASKLKTQLVCARKVLHQNFSVANQN